MEDLRDTVADRRDQPQHCAKWGIYVYFAADIPNPDMAAAVWSTVNTLASVGSSNTVKITAMVDLPDRDTEYYIFPQKPNDPKIKEWTVLPDRFLSNVNSASIDTILDFFDYSSRNCPAEKVALIFWGHGYALDDFDPRGKPLSPSQQQASQANGRIADSFPGENGQELRLLYDATYNSVLNNRDFAQAILDFKERFNGKEPIQVLGLDCCNMAMVEVLSEFQDAAEYVVAAETALPFQSWITKEILERFLHNAPIDARSFAVGAVQEFIDDIARTSSIYVELAACNMSYFKEMETAMKQLVDALLPAIERYENRKAITQAWECDISYVVDGLIDLASFCDLLQKCIDPVSSVERAVIDAAANVKAAIQGTMPASSGAANKGGVVEMVKFAPALRDRNISLSTGLSIWFPPWIQFPRVSYFQIKQSKAYLFNRYSHTHFAKVTGWDQFLRELFRLTQGQIEL